MGYGLAAAEAPPTPRFIEVARAQLSQWQCELASKLENFEEIPERRWRVVVLTTFGQTSARLQ